MEIFNRDINNDWKMRDGFWWYLQIPPDGIPFVQTFRVFAAFFRPEELAAHFRWEAQWWENSEDNGDNGKIKRRRQVCGWNCLVAGGVDLKWCSSFVFWLFFEKKRLKKSRFWKTRWWLKKTICLFTPITLEMIQFDEQIFSKGLVQPCSREVEAQGIQSSFPKDLFFFTLDTSDAMDENSGCHPLIFLIIEVNIASG